MFCATFYSYKGGVGRTLALANVGAALAKRGKRVLLVDFDLEAPGLSTLNVFDKATHCPGVVEFVNSYIDSGQVPQVGNFIQRCEITSQANSAEYTEIVIDVMPAGRLDDQYPATYAGIDWVKLYEEQHGFLLMEDLRAQWHLAGYDYVLVDSRTGLTDVGGICTRQLPNAVVGIFFPNEQNLIGLKQIAAGIKSSEARGHPIDVMFAASRVPRLDDEHGVLKGWLQRFQGELEYDARDLTIIEHYDSLALLDQRLFVLDRPNSGLAAQYEQLAAALSKINVEDADGALRFVRSITMKKTQALQQDMGQPAEKVLLDRMEAIALVHKNDAIVQRALAIVYQRLRRLTESAIATDLALAAQCRTRTVEVIPQSFTASLHHLRMKIFTELAEVEQISNAAEQIINDPSASDLMTLDALMALAGTAPERLPDPERLPALDSSDCQSLVAVARRLAASPAAVPTAAAIAERAVIAGRRRGTLSDDNVYGLQLVLIGGGRFDTASEIGDVALVSAPNDVVLLFNTAMAHWGKDGKPDKELFERIDEILSEVVSSAVEPNSFQCHALIKAILGSVDEVENLVNKAIAAVKSSPQREMSCWTYAWVQAADFERHCRAIINFAKGGPGPEVLSRHGVT